MTHIENDMHNKKPHGHNHDHSHVHNISGKNLGIAILLNVFITVLQIIGAIFSKSLSLLSDALHNFSDVVALGISWFANKIAKRKSNQVSSYGYKRAEVIAAFINAATLLAVSIYLIIESVERLFSSESINIDGNWIIYMSILSIVVNGISAFLMYKDSKNSMNMKAAYLHLFSDMLTSVVVLIGGVCIKFFNIYWIDSVLSIGVAIYLINLSWGLGVKAIKILMQFSPIEFNTNEVIDEVKKIDGVVDMHHIHVWQLSDNDCFFEGHVKISSDLKLSEVEKIVSEIATCLKDNFKVTHATLQTELEICNNVDLEDCN